MHLTPTQIFHHRWAAALAAQDVAALHGLYHPDAVQLSVGTGQTLVGAEAIVAGYAELFGIVGAVTTTRVETFTDLGTAYVAETHQTSAFAQSFAYDVVTLEGGRARYHVSGSINPRPPALELPPDTGTPGQTMYRRMWETTYARNFAARAELYAPDAVQASSGTVRRGRDAILRAEQQGLQAGTNPQLKTLSSFVEGPGVVAVEQVVSMVIQDTQWDLECYSATILRDGKVAMDVDGLINPRQEELSQAVRTVGLAQARALQSVADGLARFNGLWR
jgi:ketosteroid isomerase-like protein